MNMTDESKAHSDNNMSDMQDHSTMDHSKNEDHDNHENHHEMMIQDFKKRFYLSLVLTIPILLLSEIIQDFANFNFEFTGDTTVLLVISSIIYFYGGVPFFTGFRDEINKRTPGMMTLVTMAITVSYVYSIAVITVLDSGKQFFWELATLIDIMLLGHWIEMRSIMGASRALEALAKLLPSKAHKILENGEIIDVELSSLQPGDRVLIRPGEKIPTDATVEKGQSSVNEAMLTGEMKPILKNQGDKIIGGSINGEGSLTSIIELTGDQTYLAQVINLVKEAQKSRSKAQDLANRAAFVLTIVALVGGTLTFAIWMALGADLSFAIERMVVVIVIACPHALGLAVPLVVSVSTSISAQNGLLIRNRIAFENARNLSIVAFDKTGTLTEGKFGIRKIVVLGNDNENDILGIAASLESHSEHPIAKGIVEFAKGNDLVIQEVDNFEAIPGKGIKGKLSDQEYLVVSPGYLVGLGNELPDLSLSNDEKLGLTIVYVLKSDQIMGAILLEDIIREESREAIAKLKSMGIKTMMITGDNENVARWVASRLNIDKYHSEVLPHQKSEIIKSTQQRGEIVAMVGDGVNDAPALVQADVGIAIGTGTDVAVEAGDIILIRNDPKDIVATIKLARKTYRKMQENLVWATGYNSFALPIAAGALFSFGILLSPAVGAAFMSVSTVIVALNAMRLKMD
ncbi:MAG: copper-translocating P-type ATPase [Candidatus Heimdallarchaeota archaeon]|nr:copper-translocating P-type ATPase [Candidatus Heimdallarchaeota archaeon]